MAKKNYVEKEDLQEELVKYFNTDRISDDMHEMLLVMSRKIAMKIQYKDKPYRDDMVNNAYMKCISHAHKYDIKRKNPFSYFQSVIENFFKDTIVKHERDRIYHNKISSKLHSEIANEYNFRDNNEEFEINNNEYDETPSTIVYWNSEFGKFGDLSKKYTDIDLFKMIKKYFENNEEISKKLIDTKDEEIIYFNDKCDNYNGHCICKKCTSKQFLNNVGIQLMIYRKYLQDFEGFE